MRIYRRPVRGGRRASAYQVDLRPYGGKRKSLRTEDRILAVFLASRALAELELAIGARLAKRRPLMDLFKAYTRELERRGRKPKHVRQVAAALEDLARRIGAKDPSDFTPARIGEALAAVGEAAAKRGGTGARTQNLARAALHAFFAWLVKTEQWHRNPVGAVEAVDELPREREALTALELDALRETAPLKRAVVYVLAATAALRRGDLRAISPEDVDLATRTLRLLRDSQKRGKRDVFLPLCEAAVELLQEWIAGNRFRLRRRLFRVPSNRTLRADLRASGMTAERAALFDLHSLRVTGGTEVQRKGSALAIAQKLLRHSDPALTARVYTKLRAEELRPHVDRAFAFLCRGGGRGGGDA